MFAKCLVVAGLTVSLVPCSAAVGTRQVAAGFERPVWAGVPKGQTGRLWVIEQVGKIWVVDEASGEKSLLLDISKQVSRRMNEEGLLGLAFAPDFATSGRFYVNYSGDDGAGDNQHTRISRFRFEDGKVDPAGEEILLSFKQDFRNHNGGWIEFGPDGMLYVGNGDGGSRDDPHGNAQDLGNLLGKMLRIDVSPETGYRVPSDNPFVGKEGVKPEIWAYGLRNPWRNSFDRETGDLWIGDVGQDVWEEINFVPKGKGAGANYGWRLREGKIATPARGVGGPAPEGAIEPIYVYKHGMEPDQGISVTGGYVYRGPIDELRGRYVFADYQNPRVWSFVQKDGKATDFKDLTDQLQPEGGRINLIASFAEGPEGDLYIVDHTGPVYKVVEK